ncbi:MAG: non-canonical purine NTP pyrophosphatase [Candidatus Cryosericum sp.]
MRLALVTGNTHKLQEFAGILNGLDCRLPLEELEVEGVVECGATYYQNGYRKARAGLLSIQATDAADCVVLADDSGLELPLFGGMPGVHSARFRYAGLSEKAALAAFLTEHHILSTPARFVCWIVAFLPGSRRCLACAGAVAGTVIPEPRGSKGFGYDPLFTPNGYSLTFSEMDSSLKDRVSHRAQALAALWSALQASPSLGP